VLLGNGKINPQHPEGRAKEGQHELTKKVPLKNGKLNKKKRRGGGKGREI